ncbi:MAG: EsaB/YukD family protein [Clostridiales bacterium]|nr:EsaB/YukD family protein [Clostridiales bacterium]
MNETAVVTFCNPGRGQTVELEIPVDITANDLILALNEAYHLEMDTENIFHCYFAAEHPIAFLRGNKRLSDFGVRNGTVIIYKQDCGGSAMRGRKPAAGQMR